MRSYAIPLGVLVAGLLAAGGYGLLPSNKPHLAGPLLVSVQPQQVLIESGEQAQSLNFDFVIENQGSQPVGVDSIELVARDAGGQPIVRRFVDSNGSAPAIDAVPSRIVAPGRKIVVFNPFQQLPPHVELKRLDYRLGFSIPNEGSGNSASITVEPRRVQPAR